MHASSDEKCSVPLDICGGPREAFTAQLFISIVAACSSGFNPYVRDYPVHKYVSYVENSDHYNSRSALLSKAAQPSLGRAIEGCARLLSWA